MEIRELVADILYRKKKDIYIIVTLSVLLSFFTAGTNVFSFRSKGEGAAIVRTSAETSSEEAGDDYGENDENDIINNEEGSMIGGTMFNTVLILSHNLGCSIEPSSILFVEAMIALLAKAFPDVFGIYAERLGFMNDIWFIVFAVVVFLALKLSRSTAFTRIVGVSAEDFENTVGAIVSFAFPFIIYAYEVEHAEAAGLGLAAASIETGISVAGLIITSLSMVISYYIVRMVIYVIDILSVTLVEVPGFSLLSEIVKTSSVILTVVIGMVLPWVMIVAYIVIFIICAILFRYAYPVAKYYENIYVKPVFGKKRFDLIATERYKKYLEDPEDVTLFIPVFAKSEMARKIHKYDRCWLIGKGGKAYIMKRALTRRGRQMIPIDETVSFIKDPCITKHKRFIEITCETTKFSVIISREYSVIFNEIARASGLPIVDKPEGALKRSWRELRTRIGQQA